MSMSIEPTTVALQDRLAYIESLVLEDLPRDFTAYKEVAPVTAEDEGAYVSAGNIVSFVAGLSALHKQDVLNSTLLAQLAANKAYNREVETTQWYGKYHEVLENLGWVVSSFDFTKYSTSGSSFQIQTVVLEILAAIASENMLLITETALAALRSLDTGSKGFNLWDTSTHSASNGNFQISPCIESDGNVAMALGVFYFSAVQVDYNFLWFDYKSASVDLYKGAQTIILNEEAYEQVRKAVIDKLGAKAIQYVADLDI